MDRKTALLIGLLAVGSGSRAQTPGAAPQPSNTVTLERAFPVTTAVAMMGKAAGVTVLADASITRNVRESVTKLPLEEGLTAIAALNRARWCKVYLADKDIPRKADKTVDTEKLRAVVQAASSAPDVNVGVVHPVTGRMAVTAVAAASSEPMKEWAKTRTLVYFVYRPVFTGAGSGDAVADYLSTQKQTAEAFKFMTPEERAQAMGQGLEMLLTMDPQSMAEMLGMYGKALQDMTPEMKARLAGLWAQRFPPAAATNGQ